MKQWLVLVVLIFGFAAPAHAQDSWPPDGIFAPGVEIVSTTQTTVQPFSPSNEPQPTATPSFDDLPEPPEGYRWGTEFLDDTLRPTQSPDGRYVLQIATDINAVPIKHVIVLYDRHEKRLQILGEVKLALFNSWMDWTGDNIAQFYTYNMGNQYPYDQTIYVVDLRYNDLYAFESPNSTIISSVFPPEVTGTPHLADFISEGEPPNRHCRLHTYDLLNRTTQDYDYGPYCELQYRQPDGRSYYFLGLGDGRQTVLVRANPLTGEHANVYTGVFEYIFWLSEDEHYAALAVSSLQMDVIDLHNQQVLYEMPASFQERTVGWSPIVRMPLEGWLFIDTIFDPSLGSSRFLHLEGDGADVVMLNASLVKQLGNGWFLVAPSGMNEFVPGHLNLFNPETEQTIPVMDMGTLPYTVVGVDYLGHNQFRITIYDQSPLAAPLSIREVEYVVKVSGVSLPDAAPTAAP